MNCSGVVVILVVMLHTCPQKGRRERQDYHICKKVPLLFASLEDSGTLWAICGEKMGMIPS